MLWSNWCPKRSNLIYCRFFQRAAVEASLSLALEPFQSATVTRKKVAGMDVASLRGLWFWQLNSSSSSFCKSAARPFFSAASKAFMVGP